MMYSNIGLTCRETLPLRPESQEQPDVPGPESHAPHQQQGAPAHTSSPLHTHTLTHTDNMSEISILHVFVQIQFQYAMNILKLNVLLSRVFGRQRHDESLKGQIFQLGIKKNFRAHKEVTYTGIGYYLFT